MAKRTIYIPQPSHPDRAQYDYLMLALGRKGFGIENIVSLFPQAGSQPSEARHFRALTISDEDLEKLGQREVPTKSLRFKDDDVYVAICVALAGRSCYFKCMPLPDGEYEVSFKPNEGIEELIYKTVARAVDPTKRPK